MKFTEFKTYTIGELFDVFSGLSKSRDQFGYGYPFVTFKDVFDNYFLPEQLKSLANTNDKERNSCSVKKGDVFLTRTSETQEELGMSSVALKDFENATFNGFTKRLRIKKDVKVEIDLKYLGYFLRSPMFRNQVLQHSSLTTRASLNSTSINSLEILVPDIKKQIKIGQILKSLDEKIELNRQTAQTLEAIAQAIFKEWFVDFNFPGATGEMQESELGGIPKGWRVEKLGSVLDLIIDHRGKTPLKLGANWSNEGIAALSAKNIKAGRIVNLNDVNYVGKELYKKWMKDPLKSFDILLTSEAPLGEVAIVIEDTQYCLSQRLFALRSGSRFLQLYLYLYLLNKQGQENLHRRASGSTVQGIRQSELRLVEVIMPNEELLKSFGKVVETILRLVKDTEEQTKALTQLRDSLLPKLMKGELVFS